MTQQISIFDPPPVEQRLTQSMKVLKYMMDFGSITPLDALKDLAVMRLGRGSGTWKSRDLRLSMNGKQRKTGTGRTQHTAGTG